MMLKFFGEIGCGTMFLNDDATDEEIANALMIASSEEQGNGKEKRTRDERGEAYA